MKTDRENEIDLAPDSAVTAGDPHLAPFLALDRLLRYARSEALSQRREKAATLIEAAIISLPDTSDLTKN